MAKQPKMDEFQRARLDKAIGQLTDEDLDAIAVEAIKRELDRIQGLSSDDPDAS